MQIPSPLPPIATQNESISLSLPVSSPLASESLTVMSMFGSQALAARVGMPGMVATAATAVTVPIAQTTSGQVVILARDTTHPIAFVYLAPGTPKHEVNAETIALGVIWMNPFVMILPRDKRLQLMTQVASSVLYGQLTQVVWDLLVSDPNNLLDPVLHPEVGTLGFAIVKESYEKLAGSVSMSRLTGGVSKSHLDIGSSGEPRILDHGNGRVACENPKMVAYGVEFAGSSGSSFKALAYPRKGLLSGQWGWPPVVATSPVVTAVGDALPAGTYAVTCRKGFDFNLANWYLPYVPESPWQVPGATIHGTAFWYNTFGVVDVLVSAITGDGFMDNVLTVIKRVAHKTKDAVTAYNLIKGFQDFGESVNEKDPLAMVQAAVDLIEDKETRKIIFEAIWENAGPDFQVQEFLHAAKILVRNLAPVLKGVEWANSKAPFVYDLAMAPGEYSHCIQETGRQLDKCTGAVPVNPPDAKLVVTPARSVVGDQVVMDASSSTSSDGGPLQYQFDFDGDGTWDAPWSSNSRVSHTYVKTGTYNAKVSVRNSQDKMVFANYYVIVFNRASTITSVSPSSFPVSTSQTLSINGNFQSSTPLVFVDPHGTSYSSISTKLTFVSSGLILYRINTGTVTGTWTVKAVNPDGQSSNVMSFTVTAALATPVITSPLTDSGTQGTSYTYQIVATNAPTRYGATGLPAGLSVNSATGVISGTPTVNGTFTVSLSATNAAGTGTRSLTLTLAAPTQNSPPDTPSIAMPSDNATDIVVNPTVGGSTYNDPDGDAHQTSTWEIYDNVSLGSGNLVWSKVGDTTNKTDIDLNASTGTFANALSGQSKLANNTAYFARVKYTDGRGAPSNFSAASKFTTVATANNPPVTPSITAPVNNATGIAINPTIQGSTFSDPDSDTHATSTWEVYDNVSLGSGNLVWTKVGDTSNKTSIVVNTSNGTFSNALAGKAALIGDTAYFVRAQYTDSRGAASSFSTPARLTTIPSGWIAPYLPVQSSPAMAYDSARDRVVLFGGSTSSGTWESDGTTWTQCQPSTSPPPRDRHAMAYDSARGRVVLFGGELWNGSSPLSDTWEWDGTTWTQIQPSTSPPARSYHAMAYDSTRGRVVLFGGGSLSDTWEWDGTTWTQIQPPISPPARSGHAMAYDSTRGRVVLFAGNIENSPYRVSDTWEWDGTTWTQIQPSTSPPARYLHAMAYDSTRGRVVLFGGYDGSSPSFLSDTWEWDGTTWTQIQPSTSPPARYLHAMAYDSARGRVVLFGGIIDAVPRYYGSDTWEWDGATWIQRELTTPPPPRYLHAMAYDSARGRVVLFGSYGSSPYLSDTWEWDGSAWTQRQPTTSPSGRYEHAVAYDSARGRVVLFGGITSARRRSDTWEWDGTTWTQIQPPISPPARSSHAMAYDSARGRVVLFAGNIENSPYRVSDTWEWDGTTWTQIQPPISPPARHYHAMAYDSARGRVVLFAGSPGDSSHLSDTWEWDGSTWTPRQPTTSPSGRNKHAMAYDSVRGRVVLFSGDVAHGGLGYLPRSDTWEWDGSTWTQRQPSTSPSGRYGHAMAYDSARGRVVLFGGDVGSSDTWEWDGN